MQICNQNKTSPKIIQKSELEGSWAPFGEGLGGSGSSWGHFGAHLDCLLDVPNHIFVKHWSNMGSKRLFGSILDQFWEGLGRIWETLGKIWALKIEAFASHGRLLSTLCVLCRLTLCYRNPALPCFASRSVAIRGGSDPSRVSNLHRTNGLSLIKLT